MSAGGWVWDLLVLGTSFQHWPDGDPGALRDLGSAWEDLANELIDAFDQMGQDASRVAGVWGGDAGGAFARRWSQFVSSDAGGPNAYVKAASQYAEAAINTATQLEFAQLMCEIIVGITAAEIAIGLAFSEFGGEGLAAAAIAAGRLALVKVLEDLAEQMGQQILKEALEEAAELVARQATRAALRDGARIALEDGLEKLTLKQATILTAKAALRGGLTFGGADLAAQEIQIAEHHRDGVDWSMVATDTASGVIAGTVGSLAGVGLSGLGRVGAGALTRAADTKAGQLVTDLGERAVRPLLSRLPDSETLAGRALGATGRWSVATGRDALVGGLVNIPTVAALSIAQNSIHDGSLVRGFEDYARQAAKGGWKGLGEQFAAGVLGGGLRTGVTEGGHGASDLVHGLRTPEPLTADADPARAGGLADGLRGADPQTIRLAADTAGQQFTVTGLHDLQASTLHQAARLPEGVQRTQALDDAGRYGHLADQLTSQPSGGREVLLGRADVPRAPEATPAATAVPEPGSSGTAAEPVAASDRLSPSPVLADDLHELRAQHVTYSRAEATADVSESAFRDARAAGADQAVARAMGTADGSTGDDSRVGDPHDHLPVDPQQTALHSIIWRDLAGGVRGDLTHSLDHLLARPDLPAELRGRLGDVRTAYQGEGAAREAAAYHSAEADRLADQALLQAGAGHPDAAIDSVTAAGTHTAEAVHARLSALEGRRNAERAFADIPDPADAHPPAAATPAENGRPGEPAPAAERELVSSAMGRDGVTTTVLSVSTRDAGPGADGPHASADAAPPGLVTDHGPAPLDRGPDRAGDQLAATDPVPPVPVSPDLPSARVLPEAGPDPHGATSQPDSIGLGSDVPRFPAGDLKILAFGERPGATPGLIERLSHGLGAGGDAVGLRVPDAPSGPAGPGVSVLGADPIPGVTGRLSPLLRLDGLPGGSDVLIGDPATAGVADRLRDYTFPDAHLVQIVDRLPALPDGTVDPGYLELLGRATLVVGVGDELTGRLRELLPDVAGGRGPRVETIPPVFEAHPVTPPPPDGPPRVRVDDVNAADAEHAARVVAQLRQRGVEAELEVNLSGSAWRSANLDALQLQLDAIAGHSVPIAGPGGPAEAGAAHLVLAPRASGAGDLGIPRAVRDAVETGQPLLTEGGAARLLGDADPGSVLPDGRDVQVWADRAQAVLADPAAARERAARLRDELADRYPAAPAAARLHELLLSSGDGSLREPAGRVDRGLWETPLNPREVVLRHAAPETPLAPGEVRRPSVVTVSTEFWSSVGGVATANRELTEAFAAAGANATGLVTVVDSQHREIMEATPSDGLRVVGVESVWGVTDRKGEPDTRALTLLPEGLPAHVDAIVGHSRFGGGVAQWLHENVFPAARRAHVMHTSPEVLDALKGDTEGLIHAQTERDLIRGADVAAGVGPLLGDEAARLATDQLAAGEQPPKLHVIVPDMPAAAGDPPARPADRQGHELLIQGRADDVIKSVRFGARLAADLATPESPIKLVVRGARPGTADAQHTELLREIGGPHPGLDIEIREFTTNAADLRADLDSADLVLMPSIHEGFGLVATEATRAGKLVLTGEGTGAGRFFADPQHIPADLGDPVVIRDGLTLPALRDHLAAITKPDGSIARDDLQTLTRQLNDDRLGPWLERARETLAHPDPSTDLRRRDFLNAHHPAGSAARELLGALDLPTPEPRGDLGHAAGMSAPERAATSITAALNPRGTAHPPSHLPDSGTTRPTSGGGFASRGGIPDRGLASHVPAAQEHQVSPALPEQAQAPPPGMHGPVPPPISGREPMPTNPMLSRYEGEEFPNNHAWPRYPSGVIRLTPDQQQQARIYVDDEGKLRWARDGSVLDTGKSATFFGQGRVIFTMDDQGNFFASGEQRIGVFHHSSLAMGKPVAAAGELQVADGLLQTMSDRSGHYHPTSEMMHRARLELRARGLDVSAFTLEIDEVPFDAGDLGWDA